MRTTEATGYRWLAAFPVISIALLLTAQALTPKGLDQPIRSLATAQSEIAAAAAQPGRLYLCSALIILGLGCLAVSFVAIATLCARRPGATLATVAATIAGLACLSGVVVNTLVNVNVAGVAESPTPKVDAAQVLLTSNTTAMPTVALVAYIAGLILAGVLMGVALWRAGTVQRWLSILFPLGLIAASVAPPGFVGVLIGVPFAVAMVLLARRIGFDDAVHIAPVVVSERSVTAH